MFRAPFQGAHLRKICPPRTKSMPLLLQGGPRRLIADLSQSTATQPAPEGPQLPPSSTSPPSVEPESRSQPQDGSAAYGTSPFNKVTRRIPLSSLAAYQPNPIAPEIKPPPVPSNVATPKPKERYLVTRTPSNNLPVYEKIKNQTLQLTTIRKVSGESGVLKAQLENVLVPPSKNVWVNTLTKHVVVKGLYKAQIERFLKEKGF